MYDFESLLEFEDSLSSSSKWSTGILLRNLELKIELTLSPEHEDQAKEFTENDLIQITHEYDVTKDEFASCKKCGHPLSDAERYKSCCKVSAEKRTFTTLESSYWIMFMNNPTGTINSLPNYTQLLFLQQSIPNELRSQIWRKLFLMNNTNIPSSSALIFQNFQHSYSAENSDQICKDLKRTFQPVDFFQKEETVNNLATILNVYANYDAELGYCQGLLYLVGALYYHFRDDSELAFHALVSIMEQESELHDIFNAATMSSTLDKWLTNFSAILKSVDFELYTHIYSFADPLVFLYQWWMSFLSSHTPDVSIVNRIMDFNILLGWKVGLLKISLGLLISNKPIIMTLGKDDEEVIYQHLLNESKWGNIMNDLDLFFGNLLLSWDDELFHFDQSKKQEECVKKSSNQNISDMLKTLSFNKSKPRSNSDLSSRTTSGTAASIFSSRSGRDENDSIYSVVTDLSDLKLSDYLKRPFISEPSNTDKDEINNLKALLKRAYTALGDDDQELCNLKQEISTALT